MRRHLPRLAAGVLVGLLCACGGKVDVDPGAGSAGGAGGAGGGSCAALVADYQQKAAAAVACSPFVDSIQCTQTMPDACGCPVPANQGADGVSAAYSAAFAASCFAPCAGPCAMPTGGLCVPDPGGSTGTCVAPQPH